LGKVDENSDTVSIFTLSQETMLASSEVKVSIAALACHWNGDVLFCGKNDGGIYIYDRNSGLETQRLISHASNASIVLLFFDSQSSVLSSVDSSSRVMSHKLIRQDKAWRAEEPTFDHRVGVAID